MIRSVPFDPEFLGTSELDSFDGSEVLTFGEPHTRQSSCEFFKDDSKLEPGQRGPETKMAAETERNVRPRILATNVKNLSIPDAIFVPITRWQETENSLTSGDRHSR